MIISRIIIVIIFSVQLLGCNSKSKQASLIDKTPLNGRITYDIEYCDELKKQSFYAFYPKEIITIYNEHRVKIQAQGALNTYRLDLVNSSSDSCFALIKLFDQKFFYSLNSNKDKTLEDLLSTAQIHFFNDSLKTIAGLKSSLMTINFDNPERTSLKIYYANNDGIQPNNKIFSVIPGIATYISINHSGLSMKMSAKEIVQQTNEGSEFSKPADYKNTKQEDIESIISSLIN